MPTGFLHETKSFDMRIIMDVSIHYYFENSVHNICTHEEQRYGNEIRRKMSLVLQIGSSV